MKMFLLGLLAMWFAMNLIVWIADLVDETDAMRKAVPLFYILSFVICEAIPAFFRIVPMLPLCARYKINPFYTSLTKICCQLDTEEAREKWLSKIDKNSQERWEQLFRDYPIDQFKWVCANCTNPFFVHFFY